ncbi:MAG: hypothetical protein HRU20_09585 [Pseudomonadales bacterium]|nr:hypothetical protein [Pseudomonadales bacterium]
MLSKMDDYPLHQIADVMRFTQNSDRNFYDRYYFNLINPEEELFIVFGLGQYPNLGTQDAFLLVRHKDQHHVLRASRTLGDRSDISVGPMRIEIIEGLQNLRIIVEDNDSGLSMDVTFDAVHKPHLEPRHFIRKHGRVLFDTMRYAQLGRWTGTVNIKGQEFAITPEKWIGSRDRSWGVRPVGEEEPKGIHQGTPSMEGMWNYFPVLFDDFTVLYILNETDDGRRTTEEAIRIWHDPNKETEWLGTPTHNHIFDEAQPFKCHIKSAEVTFPDTTEGQLVLTGTPLLQTYLTAGTGYGLEPDWRHGMYQGDLEVQHLTMHMNDDKDKMWGVVETPATFVLKGDNVEYQGVGMLEFAFFSDHKKYTG